MEEDDFEEWDLEDDDDNENEDQRYYDIGDMQEGEQCDFTKSNRQKVRQAQIIIRGENRPAVIICCVRI